MKGIRRAALYLYGLDTADRRWLLGKLSGNQRDRLEGMLAELAGMGVPKGRAWLPDLASLSDEAEPGPSELDDTETYLRQIEDAPPEQIAGVLAAEPGYIVARILKQRPWSWSALYLAKQSAQKRQRLLAEMERTEPGPKPKVNAALLGVLAERLKQAEGGPDSFEAVLSGAARRRKGHRRRSLWGRLWRR